jgi:NitT/TauT family transport system substrate-binding protein
MSQFHQQQLLELNRRKFLKYGLVGAGSGVLSACSGSNSWLSGSGGDPKLGNKITVGLSWVAEAEYGGFYQAVAKGIYKDYGLDVTIQQGGPRMSAGIMLMTGAWDFAIGTALEAIKAIETGVPKVTVAAIFQKNIQVLLAHPNTGVSSIADLKGRPVYVASAGASTFWPYFKYKYGFTDAQLRPYKFDIGTFIKDTKVSQQGLLTSEPFDIEKKSGIKPVVMMLSDAGYNPYDFTIETSKRMVETRSELVQKFVDASLKGWYSYLADPKPANELIKKDNKDMKDETIEFSIGQLKARGILTSGDAEKQGIGAMSDDRWKTLFDDMVKAGVYKSSTNYREAYTLKFVNKGVDYYK